MQESPAQRHIGDLGVVGAAGGRSVSLADDRFGELWKLTDDDRKLLLLHPGVSPAMTG